MKKNKKKKQDLKENSTLSKNEGLKKITPVEFNSVMRTILSAPPEVKKKKARNIKKKDVKNYE